MNTLMMLMMRHDSKPALPVEVVHEEYFTPLSFAMFMRKLGNGEIPLPMVQMDSQKGAKLIHLADLAAYIDAKAEEARKELRKLAS